MLAPTPCLGCGIWCLCVVVWQPRTSNVDVTSAATSTMFQHREIFCPPMLRLFPLSFHVTCGLQILFKIAGFRRAMLCVSAAYAVIRFPSVSLSVCPSVTFVYSVKNRKRLMSCRVGDERLVLFYSIGGVWDILWEP